RNGERLISLMCIRFMSGGMNFMLYLRSIQDSFRSTDTAVLMQAMFGCVLFVILFLLLVPSVALARDAAIEQGGHRFSFVERVYDGTADTTCFKYRLANKSLLSALRRLRMFIPHGAG